MKMQELAIVKKASFLIGLFWTRWISCVSNALSSQFLIRSLVPGTFWSHLRWHDQHIVGIGVWQALNFMENGTKYWYHSV